MNGRLYRSRRDRVLAGVAGGLADNIGADPSIVRVVWAILVPLTGGLALLAYVVMAIVVPEDDEPYGAYFPPQPVTGWPAPPGQDPGMAGDPFVAPPGQGPPGGAAGPDAATTATGVVASPPPPGAVPPAFGAVPPVYSGTPVAPDGTPAWNQSPPGWTGGPPGWIPPDPAQPITRSEWRQQRRGERQARRADRTPGTGAVVVGGLLILLGVWFLVREYVPAIDVDRLWPFLIVALGIVLLVAAVTRRPEGPSGTNR